MDHQAVIDRAALDRMLEDTGGDPEFVAEIIGDYLDNGTEVIGTLREALDQEDAAGARTAAHSLKGNSATFGAAKLSQIAADMEEHCRAGRIADAARLLPDIDAAFAEVQLELSAEQRRLQGEASDA